MLGHLGDATSRIVRGPLRIVDDPRGDFPKISQDRKDAAFFTLAALVCPHARGPECGVRCAYPRRSGLNKVPLGFDAWRPHFQPTTAGSGIDGRGQGSYGVPVVDVVSATSHSNN